MGLSEHLTIQARRVAGFDEDSRRVFLTFFAKVHTLNTKDRCSQAESARTCLGTRYRFIMSEETIEKVYAMPRIGDQAPDFEAVTTKGKIKFRTRGARGYFLFYKTAFRSDPKPYLFY